MSGTFVEKTVHPPKAPAKAPTKVADYRSPNGLASNAPVPADAVTASASGLDPHISPENAALQVRRVAKARNLRQEAVRDLISQHRAAPDLGLLGDPGVNVLTLNLALDRLAATDAERR